MKSVLLTGLLLISTLIYAQDKPFKGAERIIVAVDTSNILNKLSLVLYDRGYSLEQKDTELKFIATKPKSVKGHLANMKIHALVKDNTLILRGSVAVSMSFGMIDTTDQYDNLKYGGMKGSIIRDAWAEIETIAKEFNSNLTYSK